MTTMTYTDVQQQQRLDDWFPGLRADMDRLRAGNAELRAALAAAELSLQLIAADNRDLEDAHRRIAELEAKLAAVPPAATSARRRWQWWRKVDAPATQPVQQDAAPHAPTLHIIAVDDALGDAAQPDARAVALQMAEEGCTVAQIAAQVDAKPATVRSWIARERAKRNGVANHA
jgi:DNA-directed RNA polymerase specialized sigma24 family protein